jgi:Rrf2 family nitric oxide-sensitive transcriptional repressor
MRLTSFTDFGLRALMRLAGHPGRRFAADQIARAFGISGNHLTKVIREWAAAGGVTTRRGAGGGFRLARSTDDVIAGEIVRLQETRSALVECACPARGRMPLAAWEKAGGRPCRPS